MVAVRDMPDSWDIPKQKELNMAEEKRGIEETKELLEFVFSLAEAIKNQMRTVSLTGEMVLTSLNPSRDWGRQLIILKRSFQKLLILIQTNGLN